MDPATYRERVHDVFADPDNDVEEGIQRALELGAEYLGLSVGFFTRIDAGTQEIVQSTGEHSLIQPGETCPLDDAYCRRTVELDSPLAVQDSRASAAITASAVETFDLGAYIGARVTVDEEVYGTVCFADEREREVPFSDAESHFVELVAKLAGGAIERRNYERELAEREAALDERQEIYRAVIDASFDLVFRIGPDGAFTYLSSSVEDLLGYPPETYVDAPFTAMLPDGETVGLAEELFEEVMAGRTVEEHYFPVEHHSGDTVYIDIRVTPIYEGGASPAERTPERIVGAQGTARDATDRYRRDQLIRVMNRVLRHNLRNDMNVIGGVAELLRTRLTGEDADLAAQILETSDRLVELAETARELQENWETAPELTDTDVVPLVEAAASQVTDRHPAASISVETPGTAVARTAPRLETALRELLDNAAKHGGEQPSVDVDVAVDGDAVVIVISDDGPGLPAQERAVLLGGEETALGHGSGLGLWLVRRIVESIDGTVRLEEDGAGTHVEIRLPVSASEP